ncbi:type VII secretion-associated serine protease [Actinoplanes sp. NBRC 14428]|nr:type VII secretion-associated serine protease [Actinoplanes sp. NBRC 14428]
MTRASRTLIGTLLTICAGMSPITPAYADSIRKEQWHLESLNVVEAHRISTGKGVTVAVIDSGVSKHPDLSGRVIRGTDFVQKGQNGQTDNTGHGTGMAGLIAAHGRSDRGALGIAPDARILPIRVFDAKPRDAEIGLAISYAVTHGAKVINLSVGGGVDPETISAVRAAADADVVVVAAAGNKPQDAGVTAPAFLDSIVAVGATDRSGRKAAVSVTGPALDLMAPGVDIESTSRNGRYRAGTGTSDSAAIVSGAAALLRSKFPEMSAEEVVARLESTATDKGPPGVDDEYGHGIVNIVAALSDKTTPASAAPSSSPPAPTADAAPKGEDKTEPAGNNTPLIAGGAIVVLLAGLVGILWVRRRSAP